MDRRERLWYRRFASAVMPIDWLELNDELSPDMSQKKIATLRLALERRLPQLFGAILVPPEIVGRFADEVRHWQRCSKLGEELLARLRNRSRLTLDESVTRVEGLLPDFIEACRKWAEVSREAAHRRKSTRGRYLDAMIIDGTIDVCFEIGIPVTHGRHGPLARITRVVVAALDTQYARAGRRVRLSTVRRRTTARAGRETTPVWDPSPLLRKSIARYKAGPSYAKRIRDARAR